MPRKILMKSSKNEDMLTFGGHLEVLRRTLFRIIAVVGAIAMIVFYFKETTWEILLAPVSGTSIHIVGWNK